MIMSALLRLLMHGNPVALIIICGSFWSGSGRHRAPHFVGGQTRHLLGFFTGSTTGGGASSSTSHHALIAAFRRLLLDDLTQSVSVFLELFITYFLPTVSQRGCHSLYLVARSSHARQYLLVR